MIFEFSYVITKSIINIFVEEIKNEISERFGGFYFIFLNNIPPNDIKEKISLAFPIKRILSVK